MILALVALLAFPLRAAEPAALLFIGDSHSTQEFGRTLDADLRAQNGKVATFAVCAARPQSFISELEHGCGFMFKDFDGRAPGKWNRTRPGKITVDGKEREVTYVKTPKLAGLLADYRPQGVIVALGSNGLSAESVRETLALIHGAGAACFWIGPPRMRTVKESTLDGYYALLSAARVSPDASPLGDSCRLILDSRSLDYLVYPPQGGDGIHYASPELSPLGRRWGHDAAKAFGAALKSR